VVVSVSKDEIYLTTSPVPLPAFLIFNEVSNEAIDNFGSGCKLSLLENQLESLDWN
jgi:hypothetical protein